MNCKWDQFCAINRSSLLVKCVRWKHVMQQYTHDIPVYRERMRNTHNLGFKCSDRVMFGLYLHDGFVQLDMARPALHCLDTNHFYSITIALSAIDHSCWSGVGLFDHIIYWSIDNTKSLQSQTDTEIVFSINQKLHSLFDNIYNRICICLW